MKKMSLVGKVVLFLLLVCLPGVQAQRQFDVPLWPHGLPNSNGKDSGEENVKEGIYKPEIKVFLPSVDKATGRAVLCCPGGGYSHLALSQEGYDWAPFFNDMGIAYVVLKYRMPNGHREVPFSDAEQALRIMHEHAVEWGLNPYDIGIMGSSAGGHLASTMATSAPYDIRPDFQILFYPVVSMQPGKTHKGSVYSLLGKEVTEQQQKDFSNERKVRRHLTPPALLLLSSDDVVVPPGNSINYFTALNNCDIPASMHIYPTGNHGWGCRPSFPHHEQMLNDLTYWLNELPSVQKDVTRVACVGNSITDGDGIRLKERNGYPAVLNSLLGENYLVKNFGASGHTILKKGDRPYFKHSAYEACKKFNPDIVVIKLGTNDSKPHNWQYKAEYEKDMQCMIDELKALPAKPIIYLAYPAKPVKPSWGISDSIIVHDMMPVIKKLAKKNKLQVIDLYKPFEEDAGLMQWDGIHPNEKGARRMAEEVYKVITQGKKK